MQIHCRFELCTHSFDRLWFNCSSMMSRLTFAILNKNFTFKYSLPIIQLTDRLRQLYAHFYYIVYLVGVVILYLSFFNVYFKCFRFCCILLLVLFLTSKSSIQDALSARLKWSHCGDCGSQLNLDPLVMWHFCKGVINYHQLYCLGVTKAPTVDYCCPAIWCVVFAFYLP